MFTNKKAKYNGDNNVLIDAACLSTDTKPTTGIANGSKCIEMDTGKTFMFNEEDSEWEELPSSGGGGGSSDFSTATVTIGGTGVAGFEFPCVGSENDGDYGMCGITSFESGEGSDTFYIPLYKNECTIAKVDGSNNISVTGDVVYDSGNLAFLVSGNGTITIS